MKARLKPLAEQVVVIVGASSGIGLATARLAARRGARLVLAGRSADALHLLAAEIRNAGGQAATVIVDVGREADVERIADEARRVFGGFDTWINNAGVSVYGACLDVSTEDMQRVIATNLWGTIYGSRVACRYLRQGGGALINVGSAVSDRAVPLQGIYSTSKHGIKGWTDALRVELAHEQAPVAVTLVKPAPINTPYAEHAKNYLPDQPTHVPPVYSTGSVANAILYAAEHPLREVYVGSSARILGVVNALIPGAVDRLMAGLFVTATHSHRARHGRPILHRPSEDLREDGDYAGVVRPSLYTAAVTRPRWLRAGAFALGAALVFGAMRLRQE
jgi:short-subunit dehydrogenase